MVQWLGLCTLTANGRGSICSQGTKISQLHTNNNNNNKGEKSNDSLQPSCASLNFCDHENY